MAIPTAQQRRSLAKAGISLPDGSFYVRDEGELDDAIKAVGRTKPAKGQTAEERRNEVRRHIIKRAKALKLDAKIPDTWAPDGSLKHENLEDFIAHFGRKGMKWGEHRFTSGASGSVTSYHRAEKIDKKIASHEAIKAAHLTTLKAAGKSVQDLEQHGAESQVFKDVFGKHADLNELQFQYRFGQSKGQAALSLRNQGVRNANYAAKRIGHHEEEIRKLQEKKQKVMHADFDDQDLDAPAADDLELVLIHFGRKGMKWGEHRFGRDRGASAGPSSSSDHTRARAAHVVAKAHGTHALSNEELKTLTDRLNLEQSYRRLTAESTHYDKGKGFVQEVLHLGKLGLDAYNTGKAVKKAIDELKRH